MELIEDKYKQTKVGLIPKDWEVKSLAEIGKFSKGSGVRKDEAQSGEIPCIRYGEIYTIHNDYIKKFNSFISRNVADTAKRLKSGDILFAGSGETKEEIGKSVAFIAEFEAYAGGDIVILSASIAEPLYLGYLLNSPFIQKQKASRGQGDAVVHISASQLGNIKIPLPPTKIEQIAIATVLSDADALISSLSTLITKKRMIKQGAMQELLKPKEGWEVKKLGELGKTYGGLSGKSKEDFQNGTYPYIPFMNIMNNPVIDTQYFDYVKIGSLENQNKAIKGDLFFNGSSETPEEVGMCSLLMDDITNLYLNSFCFGFRFLKDEDMNGLYFSYFFRSEEGRKLIYSLAQGATRYNLSKANFLKMILPIPPKSEQTRIANILSDMDAEIAALEKQLTKARCMKQGMMQILLTGKVRLI